MLEELMLTLDHDPNRTVMVGDAEFDLLMARSAGTASVGIAGGAHDADRLSAHQPLAVLDRVTELPRVIGAAR
jgi:phosphoglycolate phosphatase